MERIYTSKNQALKNGGAIYRKGYPCKECGGVHFRISKVNTKQFDICVNCSPNSKGISIPYRYNLAYSIGEKDSQLSKKANPYNAIKGQMLEYCAWAAGYGGY